MAPQYTERMATLSEVAALAGVSISAVSRVLSNAPSARVKPETRQRIHDAAARLDYRPNFAARALKSSRTNVVALVVPDLTNAIFTELMRGVEEEALRRGYMVLLARTEGMPEGEEWIPQLVGEGRVDGVLVQIGDNMRPDDLKVLLSGRVPAVLVNSLHHGDVGSVALDDEMGARVATEHLLALGHTRIALLNGLETRDTAQRRKTGFLAAMADAGITVPAEHMTGLGYEPAQGRAALRAIADLDPRPTAAVVANVNAAIGLLREARTLHIRVPDDMSIVAIHDVWTAENTWPPLTTVRMPLYELGRESMIAIFDRIVNRETRDRIIRDPLPRLMVRESTAPLRPPGE